MRAYGQPTYKFDLLSFKDQLLLELGFPGGPSGKEPPCQCRKHKRRTRVQADALEEGMAIHSWRIRWTEELGGLQFTGLQRVGHDFVTKHAQIIATSQEKFSGVLIKIVCLGLEKTVWINL